MTARDLGLFAFVCYLGAAATAFFAGPGSLLGPLVFIALTLTAMLCAHAASRPEPSDRSRRTSTSPAPAKVPVHPAPAQQDDVRAD